MDRRKREGREDRLANLRDMYALGHMDRVEFIRRLENNGMNHCDAVCEANMVDDD